MVFIVIIHLLALAQDLIKSLFDIKHVTVKVITKIKIIKCQMPNYHTGLLLSTLAFLYKVEKLYSR